MTPARLNETVYAKLAPSPVHGVGVFAIRPIPKGTPITDYRGENIWNGWVCDMQPKEFEEILPEIQALILDRMIFEEGKSMRFTSPNASQLLIAFLNHSEDPNTDGLNAVRDIAAGEEITEDFRSIAAGPLHPLTKIHMPFL